MPRHSRCLLAGAPCHVTQRGVDRRETFSDDADRATYLSLMRRNLSDTGVRVLGWCLMPNHVHLVALPERVDSLSILLRRVHGRYSQYYNARYGRSGHLWQNRYFACCLGPGHLWAALQYIDNNPVRAGFVQSAADYRWSSAVAHLEGRDPTGVTDLDWWRRESEGLDWRQELGESEEEQIAVLRQCTYSGRPYGEDGFVQRLSEQFERHWTRGRPPKQPAVAAAAGGAGERGLSGE